MSELPPARLKVYLEYKIVLTPGEIAAPATIFDQMRNAVNAQQTVDTFPWEKPADWDELWGKVNLFVWAYMRGESMAELHPRLRTSADVEFEGGRGQGKPIPKLLNAVKDTTEALARDAGCLVALHENAMREANGAEHQIPESLAALPLCIRNGCDSLKTLSFFRAIYRQRMFAHRIASYFPLPADMVAENQRNEWVRGIRLAWLQNEHPLLDEDQVLTAAKLIVKENTGWQD
jgi:hypothetical protein